MNTTPLTTTALATALLSVTATVTASNPAEDQFAVAAAHYEATRWRLAVDEFQIFIATHVDHQLYQHALFYTGEALVQLGNYAQASKQFRQYLDGDGELEFEAEARFRIGEGAYFRGQYDIAQQELVQFRESHPRDAHNQYALVYLGEMALSDGDAVEAQRLFSQVLADHADGEMVYDSRFGLAKSLEKLGHTVVAMSHYKELARQQKHALADNAQLRLAIIEFKRSKFDRVEQLLHSFETKYPESDVRTNVLYWLGLNRRALRRWNEAGEMLSSAVSSDPRHELAPAMHYFAGDAYLRTEKTDEALAHFKSVLEHWPESEYTDDALLAQMRIALKLHDHTHVMALGEQLERDFTSSSGREVARDLYARALLKEKQFDRAIDLFQQWIAQDGKLGNATAWYLYALAQLGAGQWKATLESLGHIDPATTQAPLGSAVDVVRSSALIGLERYSDAIQALRGYLKTNPRGVDTAKCTADLTICLTKTGKSDEAAAVWEKFQEQYPDYGQRLTLTHFLAETAYAQGDRIWAQELFTELAAEENPPEFISKGLAGLAWCQLEANDTASSAQSFERLLKKNADSPLAPEAALMQGRALEREKKWDGALVAYTTVIRNYANSKQMPDALFSAARIHDRLEQDMEADEFLQTLVEQFPNYRHFDAALYTWAWVLLDLERKTQGMEKFQRLHNAYKESDYWGDASYRLAEHCLTNGEYEQARNLSRQIANNDVESQLRAHALYLDGRASVLAEQWFEVGDPLNELVREFPNHSLRIPAEYWIAEALYRSADYEAAEVRYTQLAKRISNNSENWMGIIPLRQAQVLAHQNQWSRAYDVAVGISKNFPNFKRLYEADYVAGRCLAARGEFTEARASYDHVVASTVGGQTETAAMAQWMIGETYFHQQRLDEAIRAYLRVEILYDYPRWRAAALLQAGKCYELKNNEKEAVRLYSRVVKEYPSTTFTEQAAQRLRTANQREKQTVN